MTEEEYQAALAEIDKLMDVDLGHPNRERFEELIRQVEEYEKEHFPEFGEVP